MMPKTKNRPASGKRSWIFVAITAALILSIGAVAWTMRSVAAPVAVAAVKSERITLDPNRLFGAAREAYEVAAKNPALLVQLHCYCGCYKELGHQCLLDCYRDEHGAHCPVCTGRAGSSWPNDGAEIIRSSQRDLK